MSPSDINVLNAKLEYVQEKIDAMHDMVKEHITQEEAQWEKIRAQIEKDYARKWVEVVVWFVIFAISTSVVWWVISQQATINEHMIISNSNKLSENGK